MIFPKSIGFDLETAGEKQEYALQPFRMLSGKAWITAASISVDNATAGTLNPSVENIRQMLLYAKNNDRRIVGWNSTFDASWCIAAGLEEEVFSVRWLDAMLLWRHAVVEPEGEDTPATKRKSYSLKSAMQEFFPEQAGFKDFDDFQATDRDSLDLLLHRNKNDALWTVRLAEMFWDMLTPEQQRAALIESVCIPQVARTKVYGLKADKQAAGILKQKLKQEAEELHNELVKTSPEVEGINLGSPKQLQTLLYDTWNLPAERFSKKTQLPSTDKYALFDLAVIDPRAHSIKKLREAKNNRKKYAVGSLNSLEYNGDGYVRPQAKIFSTYTSRMTYGSSDKATEEVIRETKTKGRTVSTRKTTVPVGIALHQWKRDKEYRDIIQAPPGYKLLEFDADRQEFGWMAVASGDETMLSLCAPGEDAHSYMGAQLGGVGYKDLVARIKQGDRASKIHRKAGKFSNLSYQYRISAKAATVKARIDHGLDVDETYITHSQMIYKQTYPGVGGPTLKQTGGYWLSQIQKCRQLGYAETFAGRRVQLKGDWVGRDAWPMESTAINYPIQGTGGDQKYLAIAVAGNYLNQFGGYLYYELHDGIFYIFPEKVAEKAGHFFQKILSNLPYKQAWGLTLPIGFPFSAKIGSSWGDLKELE